MNSQPSIGYISLLLVVFGRQLCLPLPADLLLVAVGALVASGRMSLPLVLCIGVSGCLAGDLVWFEAGQRLSAHLLRAMPSWGLGSLSLAVQKVISQNES